MIVPGFSWAASRKWNTNIMLQLNNTDVFCLFFLERESCFRKSQQIRRLESRVESKTGKSKITFLLFTAFNSLLSIQIVWILDSDLTLFVLC